MKKGKHSAYSEIEDASVYIAEDITYDKAYKGIIPKEIMMILILVIIVLAVAASVFLVRNKLTHNVDRYNKDVEITLREEEKAEQEELDKLNIMNSIEQPWFSGDDKGTLYFHSEKFTGDTLIIPASFDGVYIDTLGDGFDVKNKTVREVEISEGIVTIESGAFNNFTALEKVSIPKTVLYVSENAFHGTPWYKNSAEKFCVIGDGVLIKYNGNDSEIVIPDSVKYIDGAVFKNFDDAEKILIPESVKYIGDSAFYNCTAEIEGGKKVNYVANNAFSESSFVENSDENIVVIGNGCMVGYTIENGGVYVPNGIKHIAGIDFSSIDEKVTLYIGEDVKSIADVAEIGYVSAIKVDEDNELLSSYNGVLYNKDGTMLYRYPVYKTTDRFFAERDLVAIGDKAFYGCDIEKAELYDGIKSIGKMAFCGCENLQEIDLPDSLQTIGDSVFSGCKSLESVHLSNEVTVLPFSAFSGCESLETFVCGEKLTTISASAFYGCESLENFTLPDTLKKVAYNAFNDCDATLYAKDNPYFEIVDNKVQVKTTR